jgi:UDP:flavonoid glycosyltransferase YjiC (YdhE family)
MTGKTALFVWELGEGLGHLPTLKAIAAGMREQGWRIAFAVREVENVRVSLASLDCPVLQAPHWPNAVAVRNPSFSYADMMAANGFGSVQNLRSLTDRWDQLFEAARPDLLVSEHSPSAAVAAFGRIPVALVGNGFLLPPAEGEVFPTYGKAAAEPTSQAAILAVMQEATVGRERAPQTITEPFRGVFRAVTSFPELDPYRSQRSDLVLGPIEALPALTPLPSKRKVFAYSASEYVLLDELIAVLMDLGPQASVYLRGSPGARGAILKSRGVAFHGEAPALADVLPTATCVFSHAGSGLASAALAAGRPQILSPRHGEADMTAKLLEELGVGISLVPLERKRLREAIERVHTDTKFATAAQRAGQAAQAFVSQANALERTLGAIV